MSISGKARLAGVVGWPIAHSLSPRLHSYWLAAHGIDGAYIPLAVEKPDFARAILALQCAGFSGVNVTVPHKEAAFAISHDLDGSALAAGTANLLLFRTDRRIEGHNTDSAGLVAHLRETLGSTLSGKSAVVLGSGGAARAAVLALTELGMSEIRVMGRDAHRTETLVRDLSAKVSPPIRAHVWDRWAVAAKDAGLLVNATSAGMAGMKPLTLALEPLPESAVVCDLVYNPLETDLLKRARLAGHPVVDGLGMLMHQAVPAFKAFYGETPKVNPALRAELEKSLRHG